MNNITFDTNGKLSTEKEDIEWIRIWCEDTNDNTLPRVALIGDSITEGYFRLVHTALKGIANVDYLATSYSLKSNAYIEMVKAFVADSKYAVIHYNYGLHAYRVNETEYEEGCFSMLSHLNSLAKTVVATSTIVLREDLKTENADWKEKVRLRNEILLRIADELNLNVDNLNGISKELLGDFRMSDGVHFSEKGYEQLAKSVVESIMKVLK